MINDYSDRNETSLERVTVLHGHTDEYSAHEVDDHPYGGGLRCKVRYWIETGTRGQYKGAQRFARQTTNPRRPGEPWNKPHYSTYSTMMVLYRNSIDHVRWWGTGLWIRPEADARTRLIGIYDQFTEDQRQRYDALLRAGQQGNPRTWAEWEEKVAALVAETGYTGQDPVLSNGVWTLPSGRQFWLGDPPDIAATLAVARQRLAEQSGEAR